MQAVKQSHGLWANRSVGHNRLNIGVQWNHYSPSVSVTSKDFFYFRSLDPNPFYPKSTLKVLQIEIPSRNDLVMFANVQSYLCQIIIFNFFKNKFVQLLNNLAMFYYLYLTTAEVAS